MIVRLFIVKMATLFEQQTSLGQHFLVSVQQLAWARRLFDENIDQGEFLDLGSSHCESGSAISLNIAQ